MQSLYVEAALKDSSFSESFPCAQANKLDWVSIDLGHENCQQWPEVMDVAAPITQNAVPGGGMPTAFRGDASGAALQPLPASSDWQLLVDVENFQPNYPTSDCGACGGSCLDGVLRHTFPILPLSSMGPTGAPAPGPANTLASSAPASLPQPPKLSNTALNVSLADDLGTIYPVDVDDIFIPQSRTYPPNITTAFRAGPGQATSLPAWLAFSWNITLVEAVLSDDYGYEYISQRIYDGAYALSLKSFPGVAAIAQDSVEVTATDQSAAQLKPQVADLVLNVVGAAPTVINDIPVVEIEDGQPLSFTIPDRTFRVNIAAPGLLYQASLTGTDQTQASLPSWLTFDAGGILSGTPRLGKDAYYSLTITAVDTSGASNSTVLDLYVRAKCPAGLHRHFRMRLSPTNDDGRYQLAPPNSNHAGLKRSAVCSVNIADAIRPADDGYAFTSLNTSGTSYVGSGQCSGDYPEEPKAAFQDVELAGGCSWSSWKVTPVSMPSILTPPPPPSPPQSLPSIIGTLSCISFTMAQAQHSLCHPYGFSPCDRNVLVPS